MGNSATNACTAVQYWRRKILSHSSQDTTTINQGGAQGLRRLEYICADHLINGSVEQSCHKISSRGTVEKATSNPPHGLKGIDLRGTGLIALPGLIDMHVHLRGLKLSYKETVATGTKAAAVGGLTVVVDMPNTVPRLNTPRALEARLREIEEEAVVDVYMYAGIPEAPEEAAKLARYRRVVGFKVYPKDLEREEALRAAANQGLPIILHPELPEAERVVEVEEPRARDALRGCPLEAAAPYYLAHILDGVEPRLHITHASCPHTVKAAKDLGASVDITPHHLIYDTSTTMPQCYWKVNPPLRGREVRTALLNLLVEGSIDAVGSDHAPHAPWEKSEPLNCRPGISWLELWPSLVYSLLRPAYGSLGALKGLARLAYEAPRRILGLPPHAVEGGVANYTVLSLERTRFIGFRASKAPKDYHLMLPLSAETVLTVVRGKIVFSGFNPRGT